MQYFVLPAIVTATGLLAGAAPVNKEETGIQPLAPPATRPGAPLVLQWNPDVSGSKEWKHMSISLVSVDKDGQEKTKKLVSNIDGTNPSKTNYTTEAPKHPKNSNVYFVEFSDGKTKKKSPHFTIENTDSSYHVRRHENSESSESAPNPEIYSADGASPSGERTAAEVQSQQGQMGRPVNIGGVLYVPVVPDFMLESLSREAHDVSPQDNSNSTTGRHNTTSASSTGHPSNGVDRNIMAHFESEGQHLVSQGVHPTSSSSSGHATGSVSASPKSSSHKHSTKSANATATSTKSGHGSASQANLEGALDSASVSEKLSSLKSALPSHTHTRTSTASPTSGSSSASSHGSHGLDNIASQLFNVPSMKKRSEGNMNHIISRIATVNSQVSHAFAANTHGAGHGNLTNTASGSGSATESPQSASGHHKSKHQAESTGHHHGNATSTASASSTAPTSASNTTSAKPTSASSHKSRSSSAHELSSELLSSLATVSTSRIPKALSSLGITQSASLFAGMDPLDGFRSSSDGAKTSSQPSSTSSSSQPSSTSSSSSQPSSSSSSTSSPSSASLHHHAANATHAQGNSTSAAKPTSMAGSSMTRSRGSGTRTSGSQRHSSDMAGVLAQGILGDTGLSPSQISQYYGSHNSRSAQSSQGSHSAHSSHSGHSSQPNRSHGQGHMSASLNYKHGYQSVSQSF